MAIWCANAERLEIMKERLLWFFIGVLSCAGWIDGVATDDGLAVVIISACSPRNLLINYNLCATISSLPSQSPPQLMTIPPHMCVHSTAYLGSTSELLHQLHHALCIPQEENKLLKSHYFCFPYTPKTFLSLHKIKVEPLMSHGLPQQCIYKISELLCLCKVIKHPDSIKNTPTRVPNMNEDLTGPEHHEGQQFNLISLLN